MRKLITLVVILVIGLGIWWRYSSYVNSIKKSVQGDPVRTVNSFMDATVKFSNLLWNEEVKEALKKDLKKWIEQAEEEGKEEIPESFKKYGIENPSRLFENKRYGKAAAGVISFFQFDSFSVEKTEIEEDSAIIEVKFLPQDFMGIGKIMDNLDVPKRERKEKPVFVPFHLKKHWHRWYIVDIRGELEKLTEATYKLRKYK